MHVDLVGFDHAKLSARFFLDHVETFLQVSNLRRQPVVGELGLLVLLVLDLQLLSQTVDCWNAAPAKPHLCLNNDKQCDQSRRDNVFAHASAQVIKGGATRVAGDVTQIFFDAQQLVVFGHAVRATQGAGLDLSGIGANGNVGDGRVFGLA